MRRHVTVLAVVACLLLAAAPRAQVARHVAAPASDIVSGRVVLPEPGALDVSSTYAVLELPWSEVGGQWVAALELPVEREGPLAIALVGVDAESWTWALATPGQPMRSVETFVAAGGVQRNVESIASDDPRSSVGLEFTTAQAGTWRVSVRAPTRDEPSQAWLALRTAGADDVVLHSHLGTNRLLSDRAFSVVASLDAAVRSGTRRAPLTSVAGEVLVESAAGRTVQALWDDGLHDDGAAGDGIFGAWIGPLVPGAARVAVQMQARVAGGAQLARTVHHAFVVEEPAVRLAGWATTSVLDSQRLDIEIALQPLTALRRLHLSAEVWGTNTDGAAVPVAWLSYIGQPVETWGTTSLDLQLDGRWLVLAGAADPLELRRVRLQDPDTHVVFDELAALTLPAGALPSSAFATAGSIMVTPDMLMGAPPAGAPPVILSSTSPPPLPPSVIGNATLTAVPHHVLHRALLLSHGYCSSGNIWPPADFSAPKIEFLDPNANRSNDEFALRLAAAGAGKDSFGFVGHSQGGLAALHLLTYYTSGLDFALGPRRIQSVAAPYQGTPLASLGFFACGVNDDMTPSGAALWLAGIPSWARNEVFYWTTQNSGSACNFFTNLILASPNDGTVEKAAGQLPGAHSMGHVPGWCHTTGMSNPANYTDHARNAQMNAQAAR